MIVFGHITNILSDSDSDWYKEGSSIKNQLSDKPIQATYNYLVPIVQYTIRSTKS